MNRHFRILQERIEPAAVGARRQVQNSAGAHAREHLKGLAMKLFMVRKKIWTPAITTPT